MTRLVFSNPRDTFSNPRDMFSNPRGMQVEEVNAYGVQIPGHDGRAGMVALVCRTSTIDLQALYQHICIRLPAYARPLFIRIQVRFS